MSLDANPKSIFSLFRDTEVRQYVIPKYQRAYSWDDEVVAFCEDLNQNFLNSNTTEYFFGAIITVQDNQDPKVQQIIDGQQRMTTFTLLLAELMNLCNEILNEGKLITDKSEKVKFSKISKKIELKKSDLSQCLKENEQYRLILSQVDKDFFNDLLNMCDEVELLSYCEVIIDGIDKVLSKSTNASDDTIKEFNKKLNKDILKIDSIPVSINWKTFEEEYFKKHKICDRYEKKITRRKLITKYIQHHLENNHYSISDYDVSDALDEQEITFIEKFIHFDKQNTTIVSHKNLLKSRSRIQEIIIKMLLNNNNLFDLTDQVLKYLDFILSNTNVVRISSSDIESSYIMFQVLNDRGKTLGVIDLLRPYTMQLIEKNVSTSVLEDIGNKWDNIATRETCMKYLKDYLSSYVPVKSTEKNLHNLYKKHFFNNKSSSEIVDRIERLNKMQYIYEKIINGEWPYESGKANNWQKNRLKLIIKTLNYVGVIPLIIAIYEECNEEDLIYAIDLIERCVFRYITIAKNKSTKITNLYKSTIKQIRKDKKLSRDQLREGFIAILKSEENCSIEEFKNHLSKLEYSNDTIKVIRYFLSTLEYFYNDYKINSSKIQLDSPSMSIIINEDAIWIEHVYPQSPISPISELEEVKHCLGNLVLLQLDENRKNSNKDFLAKRASFKKEKLDLTSEISDYKDWDKSSIENRLLKYQEIASKIFTINGE